MDETGPGGGSRVRGFCICPKCGYETTHMDGRSCCILRCPECGAIMERDLLL
ncbi:MAG TPA: hypothetical protein PK718_05210 [Candidatus Methanofastidiosa archaeon]|nr:hypothetical protein [Candidatus Methanofastidiosa archaeon]HPR41927.1 hypothetical protein [Candidatus Methanofastidiosa archaeon]